MINQLLLHHIENFDFTDSDNTNNNEETAPKVSSLGGIGTRIENVVVDNDTTNDNNADEDIVNGSSCRTSAITKTTTISCGCQQNNASILAYLMLLVILVVLLLLFGCCTSTICNSNFTMAIQTFQPKAFMDTITTTTTTICYKDCTTFLCGCLIGTIVSTFSSRLIHQILYKYKSVVVVSSSSTSKGETTIASISSLDVNGLSNCHLPLQQHQKKQEKDQSASSTSNIMIDSDRIEASHSTSSSYVPIKLPNNNNNFEQNFEQHLLLQYIHERRVPLCQLLGSIGAPLLSPMQQLLPQLPITVLNPSTANTATTAIPNDNEKYNAFKKHIIEPIFDKLETLCQANIELLYTIQHCLDIVTASSRIRFGLGIRTKNGTAGLDRIERQIATVSANKKRQHQQQEQEQHHHQNNKLRENTHNVPIGNGTSKSSSFLSLQILRTRVYTILGRQLLLLHHITRSYEESTLNGDDDMNDCSSDTSSSSSISATAIISNINNSTIDNDVVITISLLRSMRNNLIHSLSDIVSTVYQQLVHNVLICRIPATIAKIDSTLSVVISTAIECNDYLKSSLLHSKFSCSNHDRNLTNDDNDTKIMKWLNTDTNNDICKNALSLSKCVETIQSTLQTFQTLMSCYSALYFNSNDFDNFFIEFQLWWNEFQQLAKVLQLSINTTNDELIMIQKSVSTTSDHDDDNSDEEINKTENSRPNAGIETIQHEYNTTGIEMGSKIKPLPISIGCHASADINIPVVTVYAGIGTSSSSLKRSRATTLTTMQNVLTDQHELDASCTTATTASRSISTDDMTSLIDELKRHMRLMPTIPEMEVSNSHLVTQNDSLQEPTIVNGTCRSSRAVDAVLLLGQVGSLTVIDEDKQDEVHHLCSVPMFPNKALLANNFLNDLQMSISNFISDNHEDYLTK
jgi:hypothetical protein